VDDYVKNADDWCIVQLMPLPSHHFWNLPAYPGFSKQEALLYAVVCNICRMCNWYTGGYFSY